MEIEAPDAAAPLVEIAAPVAQPASIAASEAGNFGDFRVAERAERAGKPLAAVTPAPITDVTPPADADRQLSKRQQETNDRIRDAVSRATADKDAEIARLRASAPPVEVVKPAVVVPEYKRYLAMPDAPKLAQFDDLEEHAAAMAVFIADKRMDERTAREATDKATAAATEDAVKTLTTFQSQLSTAGKGNAKAFTDTLTPEVQGLQPVESLQARGEVAKVGPLNVLTSHIIKSAVAPQLLQYFSDHPEELRRFEALPTVGSIYVEVGKVEARLDSPTPAALPAKTVTSAPPPPPTFGARPAAPADPSKAAVETGNFGAFRAAESAKRSAQRA